MPRTKTTHPRESREKGEKNIPLPEIWLPRHLPAYYQPEWLSAKSWRAYVKRQPIALICRDSLISSFLSLDWKIEPKDTEQRDELKEEIKYYTGLFTSNNGWDYDTVVAWIGKDMLDLPFGGAAEVGREGDTLEGRVVWFEPLDGATLFPTRNADYPVGQRVVEANREVYFPAHCIDRVYYAPRTDIHKFGWGIAPPEAIYLAIELINRGDNYYAKLLLDTPEAGILDLIDMEKDSAEAWVKAWREMNAGVDPYKVAVLYEHERPAQFIPFQRSPTEIMFDTATMKYATVICAGYGISMSDIGFSARSSGGETLAGTIRDERRTRRTGSSYFKKKMVNFYNRLLPDTLEYKVIDTDEEYSVAMTRARLAGATAATAYIDSRIFSPAEMRQQAVADGLVTISVPEDPPEESEFPDLMNQSPERPNMMGRPVNPSEGGHGEAAKSDLLTKSLLSIVNKDDKYWRRMIYAAFPFAADHVKGVKEVLEQDLVDAWMGEHEQVLWGNQGGNLVPELPIKSKQAEDAVMKSLQGETWYSPGDYKEIIHEFDTLIRDGIHEINKTFEETAYITGSKIDPIEDYDKKFLENLVWDSYQAIPKILSKSVVSGLSMYLLKKDIEIEEVFENIDLLFCVKSISSDAINVLISDISAEISDIIFGTIQNHKE